jgi:hypothetical protein
MSYGKAQCASLFLPSLVEMAFKFQSVLALHLLRNTVATTTARPLLLFSYLLMITRSSHQFSTHKGDPFSTSGGGLLVHLRFVSFLMYLLCCILLITPPIGHREEPLIVLIPFATRGVSTFFDAATSISSSGFGFVAVYSMGPFEYSVGPLEYSTVPTIPKPGTTDELLIPLQSDT